MRNRFLITLEIVIALVFAVLSGAGQAEEYIMKFCWVDPPDPFGQSTSAYAVVLKAEVEKLSAGRIKVELYPAGQLGDQRSGTEQVRKGTIEAYNISSGVLASLYYPELSIFDMPFSFSSREVARRVFDNQNPFTKELIEDCARKTGIRILSLMPFGFRHFTNSVRPIRTPKDMEGLKIRTIEIVPHMKLVEALGATPVPIPFLELYTSLQTKVVDGQENTLQNIVAQKFYQVQKYLTLSGHLMGVGATLVNEKWYQSLPDDLKLALVEGERVAQATYNGIGALLDAVALDKLREYGMEIYFPTPDELQMFREKAVPYVRGWMEKEVGPGLVARYLAAIEAAEEDLAREAGGSKK